MAARHGIKSLKGVKKSRSIGNRPKHSKKSVKLRKRIREGKILPKGGSKNVKQNFDKNP